jgi:hypothetical protein
MNPLIFCTMYRNMLKKSLTLMFLLLLGSSFFLLQLSAQPEKGSQQLLRHSLEGKWKFSIGDKEAWASPRFDDSRWVEISTHRHWEAQGYEGYNGYAWYRTEVVLDEAWEGRDLALDLGQIDDADEVYVNGSLIGKMGKMPPQFETAYQEHRHYTVPARMVHTDRPNVIALRVYDDGGEGGFIGGKQELRAIPNPLKPDLDLSGQWLFSTHQAREPRFLPRDEEEWQAIQVPATWESQGHTDLDGFAWYRQAVYLKTSEARERWVLLLGKIDDLDQVYVNGELVGSMGDMESDHPRIKGVEWQEFRGYYLPDGLLETRRANEILVRVFDATMDGGIYEGPIGLITQERYIQYWREARE